MFKKKKEQQPTVIKKNISELLTKPNDRSRRQASARAANIAEETFTGKFAGWEGKKVLKHYSQHLSEI